MISVLRPGDQSAAIVQISDDVGCPVVQRAQIIAGQSAAMVRRNEDRTKERKIDCGERCGVHRHKMIPRRIAGRIPAINQALRRVEVIAQRKIGGIGLDEQYGRRIPVAREQLTLLDKMLRPDGIPGYCVKIRVMPRHKNISRK